MRRFFVTLISIIGLLVGLCADAFAKTKTVTLGTSEWPPYVMNNDEKYPGYAYEVVKAAFEAEGYHVKIRVMPWYEARKDTIKGEIDGLFPEYRSEVNLPYFVYSDSFMTGPLMLYERVDERVIRLPETKVQKAFFEQLKKYRFGIVAGYTNIPAFDNNTALKKIEVVDDKANLEQLYAGEVDFILIDKLNAQYILNNELPKKYLRALKPVGSPLSHPRFYIVFSKKIDNVTELVNDFNKGLKKIKQEKLTHRIMYRYIYEFIDKDAVPQKLEIN